MSGQAVLAAAIALVPVLLVLIGGQRVADALTCLHCKVFDNE